MSSVIVVEVGSVGVVTCVVLVLTSSVGLSDDVPASCVVVDSVEVAEDTSGVTSEVVDSVATDVAPVVLTSSVDENEVDELSVLEEMISGSLASSVVPTSVEEVIEEVPSVDDDGSNVVVSLAVEVADESSEVVVSCVVLSNTEVVKSSVVLVKIVSVVDSEAVVPSVEDLSVVTVDSKEDEATVVDVD